MAGENLCHKVADSYRYPGIEENDDDDDLAHSLDNHSGKMLRNTLNFFWDGLEHDVYVGLQIWSLVWEGRDQILLSD